jgi:uncharacterized protein (DUF1697 family)
MAVARVKTFIALLRGINVGGARPLPMKDLVAILEAAGLLSVRTYIQSGNVVFKASKGTSRSLALQIATLIEKKFRFQVPVLVLNDVELSVAIRNNPFPRASATPNYLHLGFLCDAPEEPDFNSLEKLKTATEAYVLKGRVFYLHTPDGMGNSRLAAKVERALGVDTTFRNWRTVNQLHDMSKQIARLG